MRLLPVWRRRGPVHRAPCFLRSLRIRCSRSVKPPSSVNAAAWAGEMSEKPGTVEPWNSGSTEDGKGAVENSKPAGSLANAWAIVCCIRLIHTCMAHFRPGKCRFLSYFCQKQSYFWEKQSYFPRIQSYFWGKQSYFSAFLSSFCRMQSSFPGILSSFSAMQSCFRAMQSCFSGILSFFSRMQSSFRAMQASFRGAVWGDETASLLAPVGGRAWAFCAPGRVRPSSPAP